VDHGPTFLFIGVDGKLKAVYNITMTNNTIPLADCKKGHIYRVGTRNLGFAVFNGEYSFIGIRTKFGNEFLDEEIHQEVSSVYGTAYPSEDLGPIPENIKPETHATHEHGVDWADDPATGQRRAVIRRDLQPGEEPHAKRQGFVDLWADTGERLPDRLYPYLQQNDELFKWLKAKDAEGKA
jgi:hypothetical protein